MILKYFNCRQKTTGKSDYQYIRDYDSIAYFLKVMLWICDKALKIFVGTIQGYATGYRWLMVKISMTLHIMWEGKIKYCYNQLISFKSLFTIRFQPVLVTYKWPTQLRLQKVLGNKSTKGKSTWCCWSKQMIIAST